MSIFNRIKSAIKTFFTREAIKEDLEEIEDRTLVIKRKTIRDRVNELIDRVRRNTAIEEEEEIEEPKEEDIWYLYSWKERTPEFAGQQVSYVAGLFIYADKKDFEEVDDVLEAVEEVFPQLSRFMENIHIKEEALSFAPELNVGFVFYPRNKIYKFRIEPTMMRDIYNVRTAPMTIKMHLMQELGVTRL